MASILIVDKDVEQGRLLQFYLRSLGHRASLADTKCEVAFSVLLDDPDLVLCDMELSDISGLELLRIIRSDQFARQLPVVFYTQANTRESVVQAIEAGVSGYVLKPARLSAIAKAIDQALQKRTRGDSPVDRPQR